MSIFVYVIASVALLTVAQCQTQAGNKLYIAGEGLPVWLAQQDTNRTMRYEQLEEGIAKAALDGHNAHSLNNETKSKEGEYVYLSVLVLVEVKNGLFPKNNPQAKEKIIHYHIRRTLAFWNEVNLELNKVVRNPGVQIRVVGIVLPEDQFAFSESNHRFLTWAPFDYGKYLKTYNTLTNQLFWWNQATNNFFNANNFNVIATMTSLDPAGTFHRSWSYRFDNCEGRLTHLPRASGLMFYDDGYGIQRAVGEVAHLLGRQYVGDGAMASASDFTSYDLNDIRSNLQRMSCWKEPNENWPPGKPLPDILWKDLH